MPDIVVMFFLLGVLAGLVRSDLTIPKAAYDVLSLLLMLTIGLKGGLALNGSISGGLLVELTGVLMLGFTLPLLIFLAMRWLVGLSLADSASFSAHYGSVSAGTFAVALAYAQSNGLTLGGQATLYLVVLELPAIMVALALFRHLGQDKRANMRGIWHETLTNRGVILLAGGLMIGWLYGPDAGEQVIGLYTNAFHGVLALFLLEMGMVAANSLQGIRPGHWRVIVFALLAPLVLSFAGMAMALLLGLPMGSALILATLTASASYIAAPVAVRSGIPDADIGLAMLAALGVTFPFNVLLGIPLYHWLLQALGA